MDPLRVLTAEAGFFTAQEAKRAGYGDRDIARMVRNNTWVRFRRGAYAFSDEWRALDAVGRHRVRSDAILRTHGDRVALSHVSGLVRHGIDPWGFPLDRVHVTRLDGGPGRIERDVVHHEGLVVDTDVMLVGGQLVLTPDRCAIEAGSRSTNEVALCAFDSCLREGLFSSTDLHQRFLLMQHWPHVRHLHVPVRMADARSGSVGESRGNWWFSQLGIPAPDLQHEVRGAGGALLGIVDWWWKRFQMFGEFDGKVKYGRLLKPGQDPGDVVFAEKRREDLIREATGHSFLRLIWSDFEAPRSIRARFDSLASMAG
ncbi:MAG TPA: type IV toxin-antitoxin system AbiEi family antitoxin domain-containing protein [Nocardioides sp.]|nr:type IV toxin-antitoxin system AbiEi family antitoxin domain-containing protein [Nocardioides sp.]